MLSPDAIFRILDEVRAEGLALVENPSEPYRSEFGFGRANGFLGAVAVIRNRLEAELEASAAREEQREREL